ncbi:MAG: hypothetical protein EZS28_004198 [Streblomastix strix]|uniref:Uncharacterized protein n=1 Tax=Streblomastix strix TaxID=222440 RepID=A0A5J4X0E6_9EUKA|nr:MAG: hypothetical protein EZS28_004198 [Streblomastix strix]
MLHAVDTIFHLAQSKLHEQIVNENDVFCIVECGVASGSSTAKLTYASRIMQDSINKKRKDRQKLEIKYFALDSYCGIPINSEVHRQISFGVVNECQISEEQESKIINDKQQSRERSVIAQPQPSPWRFRDANCASNEKDKESSFRGNLQSVKRVVEKYGCIDICTFIKGCSARTCISRIYPHLCAGGIILSQDGHLLAHIELLENKEFLDELDTSAKEQFKTSFETQDIERVSFYPIVEGLRQRKFIEIRMPK